MRPPIENCAVAFGPVGVPEPRVEVEIITPNAEGDEGPVYDVRLSDARTAPPRRS